MSRAEQKAEQIIFDGIGNSESDPQSILDAYDIYQLDSTNHVFDSLSLDDGDPLENSISEFRERRSTHIGATTRSVYSFRSRYQIDPDWSKEQGYLKNQFLGSPSSFYNRLLLRSGSWMLGALEQKHAWENSFTEHYALFVEADDLIHSPNFQLSKIVAGNYSFSAGSGLLFGNPIHAEHFTQNINHADPHSSGLAGSFGTNQGGTFSGGAMEMKTSEMDLDLLYSNKSYDATTDSAGVISLQQSSDHRTQNEMAKKNQQSISLIGARAQYHTLSDSHFYADIAAQGLRAVYRVPFNYSTDLKLSGEHVDLLSFSSRLVSDRYAVEGEYALSKTDSATGAGFTISAIVEPIPEFAISMLYKRLPERFFSPFTSTYSSFSPSLLNTEGLYFAVHGDLLKNILSIDGYRELDNSLLAPSSLRFPSHSKDADVTLSYNPFEDDNTIELSLRTRSKDQDQPNDTTVVQQLLSGTLSEQYYRLNIKLLPFSWLRTESRVDIARTTLSDPQKSSNSNGWVVFEDAAVTVNSILLHLRVARFKTDDFKSRLYEYEFSTQGAGSTVALYGDGMRYTASLTVPIVQRWLISVVAAETKYAANRTIGSGLTERTSDHIESFTAQLQWSF